MTYWNAANTATGDYTVKATFTAPKYISLNEPVTQQIALSVTGDKVECAIDGTVVASYAA